MLKKLLKYELPEIFKFLGIFYGLAILFSLLTKVFLSIENSLPATIIGEIFRGAAISMMFSIIINNLMRAWAMFRQKIYGDEAYLTHTLPVDRKTVYASRMITVCLSMLVSFLIVLLSLVIMFYTKDFVQVVKNLLTMLLGNVSLPVWSVVVLLLLLLYAEFLNMVQCGFTGLILGHKQPNRKIVSSVLFGFAAYAVAQGVVVVCIAVLALFNKDFQQLFIHNIMPGGKTFALVMAVCTVVYIGITAAMWCFNSRLLSRGVDVE